MKTYNSESVYYMPWSKVQNRTRVKAFFNEFTHTLISQMDFLYQTNARLFPLRLSVRENLFELIFYEKLTELATCQSVAPLEKISKDFIEDQTNLLSFLNKIMLF